MVYYSIHYISRSPPTTPDPCPQADYKMESIVYELNKVAAELAVSAAKEVTQG